MSACVAQAEIPRLALTLLLYQVLGAAAEEGQQDAGEPVPSELGPVIEPVVMAKRAFEKADAVRRHMFDAWVRDKDLQHADLLQRVCEDTGAFQVREPITGD